MRSTPGEFFARQAGSTANRGNSFNGFIGAKVGHLFCLLKGLFGIGCFAKLTINAISVFAGHFPGRRDRIAAVQGVDWTFTRARESRIRVKGNFVFTASAVDVFHVIFLP